MTIPPQIGTSLAEFIEALRAEAPDDIHPMAQSIIHERFCQMRWADGAGNHAEVVRLMRVVRDRVADELRWEAVKRDTVHDEAEASALRRRAAAFEARYAGG